MRICVNQFVPTMLLRREIVMALASIYKEIENKEVEVLKKIYQKSSFIEKSFMENMKEFYEFEFEQI